ncbi:MAG: InlB B-repeat-containing protein [Clostridium sp.]|nr:InlB B-repeat-containing protein [[Clostridium] innocuum]MCR0260631.1 InlB B-repeat-containing protein [[Clostridium] innocuum]
MNKRKGKAMKYLRNQVMIVFVCVIMIVGQFPLGNFVFAQSNGYMQTSVSEETDVHTQKINVSHVKEGITKIELYKEGALIETKPVSEALSFDVHQNGEYTLVGLDDTNTKQGEETIHVDAFDDLMIEEDKETHAVTVVSRYHSTFDITVNGKESLGAAEISDGVYQGTYIVPTNGAYTFSVVNAEGKVLESSKLTFADIPNVAKTGETIISSADDLKCIVADPSGSYILDADITLSCDLLKDVNFTGILDGNGYTISGIKNSLFNSIQNATISNIVIKGRLAESSTNSTITNAGFYVEANDKEKDFAVIMNSERTTINNSFALMNVEGKTVSGFILKGTGTITNSYVSGYLKGNEVYGFGKDVDVNNSYITASLSGDKRILFSNEKRENCFYDAQINDLEDTKATPYYTKDMISGNLSNEGFSETKGSYPEIKDINKFKESALDISKLSVVCVKTGSNLSALEDKVETEEIEDVDWKKNSNEITAESNNLINRFALKAAEERSVISAGASTNAKTTQITYPTTMGNYYKNVKSSETAPVLPTSHSDAIANGWKIVYWSGSNKATGLDWNTEYAVYSTDLRNVSNEGTIKTNYGKNGGKIALTGTYDVNETMTATLLGTNTTKGTLYWETASTLDAKDTDWSTVKTSIIEGTQSSDTYTVTTNEDSKYLRVRFVSDDSTGFKGTLTAATDSIIKQAITSVTIENKTTTESNTYTLNDKLVANMQPSGKENEVTFQWFYSGENTDTPIGTGRNYEIKGSDVGKKLFVRAVAKKDGDFKDYKDSSETTEVQSIKCTTPIAKDHLMKVSNDDITVTLTMNTDSGLYRYGYSTTIGGEITPYTVLARNKTNTTITGLNAHTTYYFYVQEVGENGYSDSDWSSDYLEVKTDNDHVKGDVTISGDNVYKKTLTAAITNAPFGQTGRFVWYRLDKDGNRESTPLAEDTDTYALTKEDIGFKIEAVYVGTQDYSGEVSTVSDTIIKEEKTAPTDNLTISSHDDTTISVTLPTNSDQEKYIIGISSTKDAVPIEQLNEQNELLTFESGADYTITGLSRDTEYFLFVRYAENDTHQKSEWINAEKAVSQKTTKKAFEATIEFTYEMKSGELMQGQKLTAALKPTDTSFNYKGIWKWYSVDKDGKETEINNFEMENDKQGTSYIVPDNAVIGTKYKVTFEANVGYTGTVDNTSAAVTATVKAQYETPDPNKIVMEAIDDTSFKVMMSEGEGKYRFWYKEADNNPWDSFVGFLNKTFVDSNDGYNEIEVKGDTGKDVYSNVDVVIEGLKRNTNYWVRVQRVGDDKGTTSEFAYSTDATKEADQSVTTKKTEIAGHVTIEGTNRYGEHLTAKYNEASYASTGSGADTEGSWQWYRGNTAISGANSTTYILTKEDIGKTIKVIYSMPADHDFTGKTEAKTETIKKAVCDNPKIDENGIVDKQNEAGDMILEVSGNADPSEKYIYYRLQKAEGTSAPSFPNNDEQLKNEWTKVNTTTITIDKDANNYSLEPNVKYILYVIKQETETNEASAVLSWSHTVGRYQQKGKITMSGDFVVGKTVKVTMSDQNNDQGTWKWYMSNDAYDGSTVTTMPSVNDANAWSEITSGFSPTLNGTTSELNVTEEMFAHYIHAEFIANEEKNYQGTLSSQEANYVKKIYEETLTITSSTKDGNGNPKAYSKSIITGTIDNYVESGNIDRNIVQFKVGDTVIKEGIILDKGKFTYEMPNNQSYDGKEITAEISTPKIIGLYVDKELKALTTPMINSKTSTNTSFNYAYGIPISNADDLESFMKQTGNYTDRSSNSVYIITNNINMSNKGVISYSSNSFGGKFDGDYHTITGLQNPLIGYVGFSTTSNRDSLAIIKNLVINEAYINTTKFSGQAAGGAVLAMLAKYAHIENIFLTNATVKAGYDAGMLVGGAGFDSNNQNGYIEVVRCGSAGGVITTTAGGSSAGGLIGHLRSGMLSDCFALSSSVNLAKDGGAKSGNVGGVVGSSSVGIQNCFSNSLIGNANNRGGIVATANSANSNLYYDKSILNDNLPDILKGEGKATKELVGNGLEENYGLENWTYKNGFYPRLSWTSNHPIAKLYSSTRGAFASVDKATSSDDIFNGDISGSIQIPTELQTSNYSITSSNENVLKVTDSGVIIPVGNAGEKATITITYTEPDETIGGTASNTYEFTVKQKVNAMSEVNITDTEGNAYTSSDKAIALPNPKMNQTLSVQSNEGTSYQWYKRKTGSTKSELIQGATASTYTVKASDIGYELCVLVEADGYASTYSSYTKAVTSIQPDAPTVSDVTDSSVKLKVKNGEAGLQYEFGYLRDDQNAAVNLIENQKVDKDGQVELNNLQRNKKYNFYVRVAAADDGSYKVSEWSEATISTLEKTSVSGEVLLGTGINKGSDLSIRIESINGQTGTWKLERMEADGVTKKADISETSNKNSFNYTLTDADVGFRIKATYTGNGDFKESVSATSEVIKKAFVEKPNKPTEVSKSDSSLTVKMTDAGTYDIGYAESASGDITIAQQEVNANTEVKIENLKRNKDYYIFARKSETASSVESAWSDALIVSTEKTVVSGNITVNGTCKVDETVMIKAPVLENLSGTWKLERQITKGSTTTISPSVYTVDPVNNTVSYQIDPKDAGATIKVTFTATGDYKSSVDMVTEPIKNAKLDTNNIPSGMTISSIRDYSMNVTAVDGTDIYQYGYALKGAAVTTVKAEDATGNAGTVITLNGLKRNTEYDLYVRKAAKTGYDASDWVKLDTKTTDKSILTGTVEYVKVVDGIEKPAAVGVADIGVTYKAKYQAGTYDQSADDTAAGTWQWYANDVAIKNATSETYTIEPMEGDVEITVRYLAKEDSDFKESRVASIGTLTKPAYDAPSQLPTVTALAEDGTSGSKLKITSSITDHVFYYVQEASNTTVPTTVASSTVENNEAKAGQWFKAAAADMTLDLKANTEYVVYVARLEDGTHQSSGVISQRAVRTVKEDLSHAGNTIMITEADDTNWKVLKNKELRISDNGKAIDGIWQYYVTTTPEVENTWANITSEIKTNTEEGKTDTYSYAKVNIPLKYANGYHVRAVFTGRGDYEGSKTYTSNTALIGTQIQGRVEITKGDTTKVFVPIEVKYIYATDAGGAEIKDEVNGIWTWYRETAVNSGTYEKIVREKDTVGISDAYTPTAEDVGKKIYAVYTGAPEGIYSGSVESSKLNNVKRSEQATPSDITVKQVNGTSVQIVLPTNMKTEGKTIAQPRLEYRIKNTVEWKQNSAGEAWIYDLKANTEYEVRVLFEGTSEYEPSAYSSVITVKTGNQSFDEENLTISEPDVLEVGKTITATFIGSGYDDGHFVVKRSDGTTIENIESKIEGTIKKRTLFTSGTNTMEYKVQSADIGSNIVIQYQANDDASTYGGYIEKSTKEVAKPINPTKAGTPVLETVTYSETTLKVKVNDANEYVFNESAAAVSETSGEWQKLKADSEGYHTFTDLDKMKSYYLHARIAETVNYRYSEDDVSAGTKPWASTQYTISYENMDGATNGDPANPTQYTELSEEIVLKDASKTGYTFKGWTTDSITTPTKGLTIPTHSSGNKTFTANWEIITYDISYDLKGGSLEDGKTNPTTYDVETESITLNNPTRTGYTFKGWSGTGITGLLETVTIPKGETGARSYSVNWEKITYDITYDLGGGTNDANNPSTYDVESNDITLSAPTRNGYTFEGWTGTDITGTSKNVTISKGSTGKREYTATWEPVTYSITYVLDGGTVATANKSEYTIESEAFTLINPTKKGYKFLGWSEGSSSDKQGTVTIAKGTTGNKTFTAHWEENTYTISYELDGGTNGDGNPSTYKVTDNDIKLAEPTKKGYTFEGWTGTDISETSKDVTISKGSVGNRTYTANWKAITYQITYDLDGGTVATANKSEYTIESEAFTLTNPTKKGYTFTGWSEGDSSDKQETVTIAQGTTGDKSYKANWSIDTYTITYDLDGGTNNVDNPSSYQVTDSDITLKAPTKKGYTFEGWKLNGTGELLTTVTISSGSTGNLSYTAIWKKVNYTVTFDSQGGSSVSETGADYQETITKPEDPTKTGYTFDGWFKESACTNAWNFDMDVVEETMTLYAKWTINEYTAIFNANGGESVSPETIKKNYDEALGDLPTATRIGHTFVGWYTKASGGDKITKDTKMPADGATYYAHWTVNQYTAKFDGNGGSNGADITADFDSKLGTLPTSSRTGYTFDGWFTTADETGTKITEETTMPVDGATYYAHWTINQYTAKFDGNGGSDGTNIKVDYDAKLGTLPTSTRTGYTFDGWYTAKTGGMKIDEDTKMPLNGATYYAHWTINQYTATFKSSDDPTDDKTITKDYDAELGELPVVTKTGYDFKGWYTAQTGGTKITMTTKMPADGATYYAQWTAHEYKIEYDLNDEGTGKAKNDPANKAKYTIEDETLTLKAPSWSAHVFTGWTYDGMSDPSVPEMEVSISKGTTGDLKFTANWRKSAHTVTFDSKGGSEVEAQGAEDNGLVPEPSNPTKVGYTFVGWYTTDDAKWNFATDTVTGDLTLYAKWKVNAYTATFDVNGGDSVTPETITKNYKEAIGDLPVATRIGHTFVGWYTKASGGTKITKETTMPLNGATYYAHWTINEYTVTFDSNGGSECDPIKKDNNTKLGTLPIPTKVGYTFLGWFTELEDGTQITKDTLMPVDGTTYYAHWKINTYTVKFETDGGTTIESMTVEHGDKLEMPADPEKEMYHFRGWYSDKELKYEYDIDTPVITDMTLYAKYEAVVSGKAEINIDKDSPIQLGNKQEEIIEAVLSEKEYHDYRYGKDVSIRIECNEIEEDERDIVKAVLNGRTIAKYFDITIYKTIDDKEVQVDKLRKVIKIVLNIPEELYPAQGVVRVFDVIRIHDGKAEILADLDKDEKTVTIESDAFSTYVLCYTDSKEDTPVIAPAEKPQTGSKEPGNGEFSTQLPSTGEYEEEAEKPGHQLKEEKENVAKKKEEAKNTIYYFLLPIALLLTICIAFVIRIKHRSNKK